MKKSIGKRLIGTYLLIIMLILLSTGAILSVSLKQYYLDNVQTNLERETRLAASMLESYQTDKIDTFNYMNDISQVVANNIDARVTIIDSRGTVVADSMYDATKLGPHNGRPEMYKALQGETGVAIRFSDTEQQQMVYVAVPFTTPDMQGVVRLARTLEEVESVHYHILFLILLTILLIGIIAFVISTRLADNFTRPLTELTSAVEEIARGDLDKRIPYWSDDELGLLASAVNYMAREMDKTLTEISAVNNRLEVVLKNTVNGIIMVDQEARITYANPKAQKLLVMGNDFQGLKHVEVINNYELLQAIDEVRRMLQPVRKEIQLFIPAEKQIEANVLPICKDIPQIYGGVLVVLNDITDLKRLERVRRDFVANVSHELKTPVASISGFAETLMNESEENPRNVREFSEIIYNEAIRLSKLINRLLDLSRLESGKSGLNINNVDMVRLIEDTVELAKQDGRASKINIIKPAGQVLVECDKELIVQVLLNLLDNALIYSPEEEPITISLEDEGEKIKVLVIDRGEGIPESEAARVFERFYRVDKARSRKTGGTGLGLSIVKHLVENHNGVTGVESTPGKGSTFYFTIPKKQK
ncbi:phosphate regulon sensor protein phor (sphs) [hydrocarbon metagenome]|uniref:histidine kinase n=1 Tax=hydrocarbon metagenome TaxID=938273 RepID=A0A0W8E8H6_9ZZZZ